MTHSSPAAWPDAHVTVAICTCNRAALLTQTLEACQRLIQPTDATWALLVVDNNSTDTTRDVVAAFAERLPLRYLHEPAQGLTFARNRVLDEVQGGHILFTDDDVLVEPTWLVAFVEATRANQEAGIFGGPIEPWFATELDPDLVSAFPLLARGFCGMDAELFRRNGGVPYGANMGFRRDVIGPARFRLDLGHSASFQGGGEETELCGRLIAAGARSMWVPSMRLEHYVEPRRTTLGYLKRYYADGARRQVRVEFTPSQASRRVSAHRWMLKKWASSFVRQHYYQLAGQRRRALECLRDRVEWQGRISEVRRIMQTQTAPAGNVRPDQ